MESIFIFVKACLLTWLFQMVINLEASRLKSFLPGSSNDLAGEKEVMDDCLNKYGEFTRHCWNEGTLKGNEINRDLIEMLRNNCYPPISYDQTGTTTLVGTAFVDYFTPKLESLCKEISDYFLHCVDLSMGPTCAPNNIPFNVYFANSEDPKLGTKIGSCQPVLLGHIEEDTVGQLTMHVFLGHSPTDSKEESTYLLAVNDIKSRKYRIFAVAKTSTQGRTHFVGSKISAKRKLRARSFLIQAYQRLTDGKIKDSNVIIVY